MTARVFPRVEPLCRHRDCGGRIITEAGRSSCETCGAPIRDLEEITRLNLDGRQRQVALPQGGAVMAVPDRDRYLLSSPPALVCASCLVGLGEGYLAMPIKEPFGTQLVCPSCARFLRATGQYATEEQGGPPIDRT